MGGETLCECRHVAEGAEDLMGDHSAEVGRDFPQPVYLGADVKLLLEKDTIRLGQSTIRMLPL